MFIVNDLFVYHFELVDISRARESRVGESFLDLCDRSWKYGNGFVVDESNTAIIIVYRNGSRKVRRWMKIDCWRNIRAFDGLIQPPSFAHNFQLWLSSVLRFFTVTPIARSPSKNGF